MPRGEIYSTAQSRKLKLEEKKCLWFNAELVQFILSPNYYKIIHNEKTQVLAYIITNLKLI